MSSDTEHFDQLPDAIVERLRARERSVAVLTPAVDRTVAEAARTRFAPRRRRPAAARRWQIPAAAAAAVALLALFIARPFDEAGIEILRLADDVDGSGQVDILDAYALARARRDDPAAVSQSRIDEITDRIVSLDLSEAVL
jgi:hypothetical protein